jgi:hypothetical protein
MELTDIVPKLTTAHHWADEGIGEGREQEEEFVNAAPS